MIALSVQAPCNQRGCWVWRGLQSHTACLLRLQLHFIPVEKKLRMLQMNLKLNETSVNNILKGYILNCMLTLLRLSTKNFARFHDAMKQWEAIEEGAHGAWNLPTTDLRAYQSELRSWPDVTITPMQSKCLLGAISDGQRNRTTFPTSNLRNQTPRST